MQNNGNDFNNKYCIRTKKLAIAICKTFSYVSNEESTKVVVRQLLRSSTSVAANFRASSRARSRAEYYSKLCIVVEECDETVFWIEILSEANLFKTEILTPIYQEAIELLKVFSTTKKKIHNKNTND